MNTLQGYIQQVLINSPKKFLFWLSEALKTKLLSAHTAICTDLCLTFTRSNDHIYCIQAKNYGQKSKPLLVRKKNVHKCLCFWHLLQFGIESTDENKCIIIISFILKNPTHAYTRTHTCTDLLTSLTSSNSRSLPLYPSTVLIPVLSLLLHNGFPSSMYRNSRSSSFPLGIHTSTYICLPFFRGDHTIPY